MPEALLSLKPQGEEFLQLYIQTLSAKEPMPSGDSPPIVIVEERAASSEEVSRLEKKPCPEGESFKIGEPATPRADLMPEAANMILALLPSGSERQDGINTPEQVTPPQSPSVADAAAEMILPSVNAPQRSSQLARILSQEFPPVLSNAAAGMTTGHLPPVPDSIGFQKGLAERGHVSNLTLPSPSYKGRFFGMGDDQTSPPAPLRTSEGEEKKDAVPAEGGGPGSRPLLRQGRASPGACRFPAPPSRVSEGARREVREADPEKPAPLNWPPFLETSPPKASGKGRSQSTEAVPSAGHPPPFREGGWGVRSERPLPLPVGEGGRGGVRIYLPLSDLSEGHASALPQPLPGIWREAPPGAVSGQGSPPLLEGEGEEQEIIHDARGTTTGNEKQPALGEGEPGGTDLPTQAQRPGQRVIEKAASDPIWKDPSLPIIEEGAQQSLSDRASRIPEASAEILPRSMDASKELDPAGASEADMRSGAFRDPAGADEASPVKRKSPAGELWAGPAGQEARYGPPPAEPSPRGIFPDRSMLAHQVAERLQTLRGGEVQEIVLRLQPEHLGEIRLTVHAERGELWLRFETAHPGIKQILESAQPQLKEILSDRSIALGGMQVFVQHQGSGQRHLPWTVPGPARQGTPWATVSEPAIQTPAHTTSLTRMLDYVV